MTPIIARNEPPIANSRILLSESAVDPEKDLLAHLLFIHVPESHVDGLQ